MFLRDMKRHYSYFLGYNNPILIERHFDILQAVRAVCLTSRFSYICNKKAVNPCNNG